MTFDEDKRPICYIEESLSKSWKPGAKLIFPNTFATESCEDPDRIQIYVDVADGIRLLYDHIGDGVVKEAGWYRYAAEELIYEA